MKNNRGLLCVLILLLIAAGWNQVLGTLAAEKEAYQQACNMAEEKMNKGLYQEAIDYYEQALTYKKSPKLYENLLSVHKKYYKKEHSETVKQNYIDALDKAAKIYPKKSQWWIDQMKLYLKGKDFEEANACLKRAESRGAKMEDLKEISSDIIYAFDMGYQLFPQYTEAVNGYYTVSSGTVWSSMDLDGEVLDDSDYFYMSRIGEDGIALQISEEKSEFVDREKVVRGFCSKKVKEAGIYAEGKIAVIDKKDQYTYINLDGRSLDVKFEEAGAFQDGTAAVKKNGKWGIIDDKGNFIMNPEYQDIKLDLALNYRSKGIVIAKQKGVYQFYDKDWKAIGDFSCEEADICLEDGVIAFAKNGKWGFVKMDGTILMEPQYEQAKSFSNGLAAVKKDGKWGFIDKDGQMVIEPQFLEAGYFNERGNCMVSLEEGYYRILKLLFF